ncbi:MAG: FtsX-like permease family protein [Proteobacteria bacterium]|nr:FtsX-like permease family protein [Pseudomonadota bacterium]
MNLILKIALRNLIRQKRRNILLGMAISFGMMILVIANSFSHGISDTLINRIVIIMTGHIELTMVEDQNIRAPFMREKKRFEDIVYKNVEGIERISENLGLLSRVVGNGKSDNCWLAGIGGNDFAGFKDQFRALEGDVSLIFSKDMVNPCILSKNKAEFLNAKLYDTLRIRLQNIHGQQQTGILTVAAIVESANMFTDFASFLSADNIKTLRGLRAWETGTLQIILKEPDTAVEKADNLHDILKPGLAYMPGTVSHTREVEGDLPEAKKAKKNCLTIGFMRNETAKILMTKWISIPDEQLKASLSDKGVLVSNRLHTELKLNPGDEITITYNNRYETGTTERNYKITGLYSAEPGVLPENVILLSDHLFYKTYYNHLPEATPAMDEGLQTRIPTELLPALSKEWKLLDRSRDFNEMKKKFKDFMSEKKDITALDIRTMHETASNIIKLERVLNLITFLAVIILFFIILIGVVNTLRMTIKERTREIGTIRAIGMQRKDVRNLIITETFLLALFSTIVGTLFSFAIMELSQLWEIHASSFMNILLVNHRLYFLPNTMSILLNMGLILIITVVTAYFPSKKAAHKTVADALRHVE